MNIFNKIYNFFFNNKKTKDLFSDINEGNIIYAKRNNDVQEYKIAGHEVGPFLIIKKNDNYLEGLYITSNEKDTSNYNWAKICFNGKVNSYVYTGKANKISKEQIINNWVTLYDDIYDYVKKNIVLNKYTTISNKESLKYSYDKGDIIIYKGNYYYIYDKNDTDLLAYEVSLSDNDNFNLIVRNNKYSIYYDKKQTFNFQDSQSFELIDMVDRKTSLDVKNDRKFRLEEKIKIESNNNIEIEEKVIQKEVENIQLSRGNLIEYNENIYYIYGEYQDKWLVYEIIEDGNYSFNINKEKYSSNLDDEVILKKEELKFISKATELEMEMIKRTKKSKIKTNQEFIGSNQYQFKKYRTGQIITNGIYRLVVVSVNNNELICVNTSNNEFVLVKFYNNNEWKVTGVVPKEDLHYIKNMLQSIDKGRILKLG